MILGCFINSKLIDFVPNYSQCILELLAQHCFTKVVEDKMPLPQTGNFLSPRVVIFAFIVADFAADDKLCLYAAGYTRCVIQWVFNRLQSVIALFIIAQTSN